MKQPSEILVADDHPIVLKGLVQFLEDEHFRVVATRRDGIGALDGIRELRPAIALLDFAMPGLTGLQVLEAVRAEGLPTHVILLTASLRDGQAAAAMERGVRGVVLKDQAADDLLLCLKSVARGERWFPPEVLAAQERATAVLERRDCVRALTSREAEIMALVAEGLSNKAIGRRLDLTEGTVKAHLHNIYQKLGVSSRSELIVGALARGN